MRQKKVDQHVAYKKDSKAAPNLLFELPVRS